MELWVQIPRMIMFLQQEIKTQLDLKIEFDFEDFNKCPGGGLGRNRSEWKNKRRQQIDQCYHLKHLNDGRQKFDQSAAPVNGTATDT